MSLQALDTKCVTCRGKNLVAREVDGRGEDILNVRGEHACARELSIRCLDERELREGGREEEGGGVRERILNY